MRRSEGIGWDDRKALADLWQNHAPLLDEGLTDRVYEALLAVARYADERAYADALSDYGVEPDPATRDLPETSED